MNNNISTTTSRVNISASSPGLECISCPHIHPTPLGSPLIFTFTRVPTISSGILCTQRGLSPKDGQLYKQDPLCLKHVRQIRSRATRASSPRAFHLHFHPPRDSDTFVKTHTNNIKKNTEYEKFLWLDFFLSSGFCSGNMKFMGRWPTLAATIFATALLLPSSRAEGKESVLSVSFSNLENQVFHLWKFYGDFLRGWYSVFFMIEVLFFCIKNLFKWKIS